ncbi:MAG: SDR family oxidoreductase [Ignavibacteriaceae bacterium]
MNNNKEVVVITGATAGVGRAVVRRFAKEGAYIGLLARGEEALENAKKEVEEAGGKAIAIPTDVARWEQVEEAAKKVEKELGPIDIWINDAMTSVFAPVKDITEKEFHRVTEVTYLGTVYGTMAALRRMLPRDKGSIVQVGSALSYRSIPLQSAYCGAKHGIRGFTNSLRSELIHDQSKVRLTMVQLPAVNTPQFIWVRNKLPKKPQPVPPIYEPEIPADAIYYAAHHNRREIFVGMSAVKTILGNKIIPGFLDHYLADSGYTGQQTNEPKDQDQPDNLWEPVSGDYGAHGNFDSRARTESQQLWASENKGLMGIILSGIAAIGAGLILLNRN